jgi:hypothetical protein
MTTESTKIPSWSQRARQAIVGLFSPLQDIDVYVEDHNDEPFYSELLRRIAPANVRIARVFAAGGREAVVARGAAHDHTQRRALFLIDGDFEWVLGKPSPSINALYRLDAYCIENLIIAESALVQIAMEDLAVDELEARRRLDFSSWAQSAKSSLLNLFVVFAAMNKLDSTQATVSRGIGELLTQSRRRHPPVIDTKKVAGVARLLLDSLVASLGRDAVDSVIEAVSNRAAGLPRPLDIISGKDFLLPLLEFHLRHCADTKCERRSLRFRMARHADLERFAGLTRALESAARGLPLQESA